MAFSRDTYTSAGEATYTITFPYLAEADLLLYVDGVSKAFTFDDATTARPTVAVTTGQVVLIERDSTREARTTDYVDASVFKASTLDADLLQCFYVAQEAFDVADLSIGVTAAGDAWDATSDKIENLLGGANTGDAVEYDQMVSYLGTAGGVPANTVAGNLLSSSATIPEWADDRASYSVTYDDPGATVGPDLQVTRTSASPADADILGAVSFHGENSADEAVVYGRVEATADDVTDATEDGHLSFYSMVNGTLTEVAKTTATGLDVDALTIGAATVTDDATQKAAILAADNAWTGSQASTFVALSDAATVLVDFNTEQNMYVTITASRTIGAPSNQTIGQSGFLIVEQDGTGGWTPSFHADWDFGTDGAPSVDTTAAKKALFAYIVDWDTVVMTRFIGDF